MINSLLMIKKCRLNPKNFFTCLDGMKEVLENCVFLELSILHNVQLHVKG